jgi:hypothetical protein
MRRIELVGLALALSVVSCVSANEPRQSTPGGAQGGDTTRLTAGRMVAVTPLTMVADPGTEVSAPTVWVADSSGLYSVSGVPVTFAITAGGGLAGENTVLTDGHGKATVQMWQLGDSVGTNTLVARAPGLAPIVFTAIGLGASGPAQRVIAKFDLVSVAGQPSSGEHYVLYDNGACTIVYDSPPFASASTMPCLYTLSGQLAGQAALAFFLRQVGNEMGVFYWQNGGRLANAASVAGVLTVTYVDVVDFDPEVYQLAK